MKWLYCLSVIMLVTTSRAFACGLNELDQLKALVQSLSPQSLPLGDRLLSCPNEAIEARQWLAFYHHVQMTMPKPSLRLKANPYVPATGNVGRQIKSAYDGSVASLRQQLTEGNPEYTQVAEVHLALARMDMLNGSFGEAKGGFEQYLRMKPTDSRVEVEYLYSSIWAGDLAQAEQMFLFAGNGSRSSIIQDDVFRGKELIKKLKERDQAKDANTYDLDESRDIRFRSTVEGLSIVKQMQRITGQMEYTQYLTLAWKHHLILTEVYDRKSFNADEIWLGRTFRFFDFVSLGLYGGYFTFDEQHLGYDVSLSFALPATFFVTAGVSRDASIIEDTPLATDGVPLLEKMYLASGIERWLKLELAILRDDKHARYGRYALIWDKEFEGENDSPGDRQGVRARLSFEERPKPSPDYETYRETQGVEFGAFMEHRFGRKNMTSYEGLYRFARKLPYGSEEYLKLSGFKFAGKFRRALKSDMLLDFGVNYELNQVKRPDQELEHRIGLMAGASMLQ